MCVLVFGVGGGYCGDYHLFVSVWECVYACVSVRGKISGVMSVSGLVLSVTCKVYV